MSRTAKSKDLCLGCRNNFYNGNNPYEVKECWSYKGAKVELRKRVSIHQRPPWNQTAVPTMSCYHAQGYVFVGKGVVR